MDAVLGSVMSYLDKETQQSIKSYDLMEEAGYNMASIILDEYKFNNVLIVLGSGGNAGDGLVVGRYLLKKGKNVFIYKISDIKNPDALKNLELYKGEYIDSISDLGRFDIIIDSILGIGLKTPLKPNYINIINILNRSGKSIISLDIPSGINSDNGLSMGAYIKSDLCITVKYPKTGLFLNDGLDSYKKLKIIDSKIIDTNELIHINEIDDFKYMVKKRKRNSNKSTYGTSSIIAGSYEYSGASFISYNALNAFKMGVGYSRLYVPKNLCELYILRAPEVIVSPLSDDKGFIKYNEDELNEIIKKSDSISIGMGMGVSLDLYETISYLLKNYDKTLIIDADGLNTISSYGVDVLSNHKCDVIITPHPKEFSRLIGISTKDVLANLISEAKSFSKKYNLTLILKGASSIIVDDDNISINIFGSTALAKASSGDALSGILAGASSYFDVSAYDKARISAFFLGYASELLDIEEEAATITDITKNISNVWKKIKE